MVEVKMSQLDTFLSRLQKVRKTGKDSWLACCPHHGDKNPSMTVSVGSNGIVLCHCHSHGCGIDQIAESVGMEVKDLMPENPLYHRARPLKAPVNPRDALFAVKDDLTSALIMAKMIQAGEKLTEEDTLQLAKIVGRLSFTIHLTGGE